MKHFRNVLDPTKGSIIILNFMLLLVMVKCNVIKENVCLAPECIKVANEFLKNMDQTADPCEDFYQFSCGNFEKFTPLLGRKVLNQKTALLHTIKNQLLTLLEEPERSNDLNIFTGLKKYYNACLEFGTNGQMNFDGVKQFMKRLGGWPVIDDKWDETSFDWVEFAGKAAKESYPALTWFLEIATHRYDGENSTTIATGRMLSPYQRRFEYLNIKPYDDLYKPMVQIARLLGANNQTVEKDIRDVINLIKDLAKIKIENDDKDSVNMTVLELQNKCPSIPWLKLINSQVEKDGKTFTEKDTIKVTRLEFMQKLADVLKTTPKRILANSLFFQLLGDLLLVIPEEELQKILVNETNFLPFYESSSRKTKCFRQIINSVMQLPMFYMLKQRVIGDLDEQNINLIFNDSKSRLEEIFSGVQWLSKDSNEMVELALNSRNFLENMVNEPIEDAQMIDLFKDLEIHGKDFLSITLNTTKFLDGLFRRVKFDKSVSWIDRLHLNPYEDDDTLLPGYEESLLKLLYNKNMPLSVNHGLLGTRSAFALAVYTIKATIGITDADDKEYEEKIKCIVDKMEKYKIAEIDKNFVVSNRTTPNIVGEITALKVSYAAFKAMANEKSAKEALPGINLTTNQLFWLSAAQLQCEKHSIESLKSFARTEDDKDATKRCPHGGKTLGRFNILGSFSNMNEFAHDFNCPIGSNMNPPLKCSTPY